MTEELNTDVNSSGTNTPQTEPVSSTSSTNVSAEGAPSADSLNTETPEKLPENIPYTRFKEVNESKKQLEQRLEALAHLEQFDQMLSSNPDMFEAVKGAVDRFNNPQAHNQSNQANDPIQTLTSRLNQLETTNKLSAYDKAFNDLYSTSKMELSENERGLFEKFVGDRLLRHCKNDVVGNFSIEALKNAFTETKTMVDEIRKSERSRYVSEKAQGEIPVNRSGAVPDRTKPGMDSRGDRTKYLAEKLRASR